MFREHPPPTAPEASWTLKFPRKPSIFMRTSRRLHRRGGRHHIRDLRGVGDRAPRRKYPRRSRDGLPRTEGRSRARHRWRHGMTATRFAVANSTTDTFAVYKTRERAEALVAELAVQFPPPHPSLGTPSRKCRGRPRCARSRRRPSSCSAPLRKLDSGLTSPPGLMPWAGRSSRSRPLQMPISTPSRRCGTREETAPTGCSPAYSAARARPGVDPSTTPSDRSADSGAGDRAGDEDEPRIDRA